MGELLPNEILEPRPTNIVTIESKLIKPFFKLFDKGLMPSLLIIDPEACSEMNMILGINTPEARTIYDKFIQLMKSCDSLGLRELSKNPTFRFVDFETIEQIDEAIKLKDINGGKSPKDKSIGVCVDLHKSWEYARIHLIQQNKPGVIFIYDSDKLEGLTEEEITTDGSKNFIAGYGVKPKEGLKLSDTVYGVIKMENPGYFN